MMKRWIMDEDYIGAVAARVAAVADLETWLAEPVEGRPRIMGRLGSETVALDVRRDLEPAAENDVQFVASALTDLRRLLSAIRSGEQLAPDELSSISSRVEAASPGPWAAFIEADGGQAGCDFIRVSNSDDQPDMYLWIGSDLLHPQSFV
jgi:hypothetical protein